MSQNPIMLTPDAYAAMLRQGQGQLQNAQSSLGSGNIRHWTQALGDVLLGAGGQLRADMAQRGESEAQAAANQAIADILAGKEGAVAAGMANPRSAQFAQQAYLARQKKNERPWWAGADGSVDPAMQRYREMGRPQTNVNVTNKGQSKYDETLNKSLAEEFIRSQEVSTKARNSIAQINIVREALKDPNLYTGAGGKTIQAMKKAAQTLFGVPVQGVSSGELVENMSAKIALSFKDDLPGPLSNSDRSFLMELPPGLTKSPDGNRLIIELGLLNQEYKLERARAAREYARRNNNRLDAGYYDYLEKIDEKYAPQFAERVGALRAAGGEPAKSPTIGTPLNALRQKYQGLE